MHLRATIRVKGWMINVWLFLAALYVLLGSAVFINMLSIPYYSFPKLYEAQTIRVVFMSPLLDKIIVHVLSILMLVSPLVARLPKRAWMWTLWSYPLFVLALLMYALGVEAGGEAFLVSAGLSVLITTLISVWALSIPSMEGALTRFGIFVCCILLAVEALSLARWILYPLYPSVPFRDLSWQVVHLETQLFYIPAGLASILLVITMFSWVAIPVGRYLRSIRLRVKIGRRVVEVDGRSMSRFEPRGGLETFGRGSSVLVLMCSIGLACLYALYPYFPSLNPEGRYVGIDIPAYAQWVQRMGDGDWSNALSYAFFSISDRPLSLLLMYGVWRVTGFSTLTVARFMPLLLCPLLILAAYYFMREATGISVTSSFAAFFTAFSYPVTVGIFAAVLSNWMGLIEVYLFSGLLLRSVREGSWRLGFLAVLTMVSLLFTHAYTWGMLMGVLGVYALLLMVKGLRGKSSWLEFKIVVAIMAVNIVVDAARNYILGSVGAATEVMSVATTRLALEFLGRFWSISTFTIQRSMVGLYMNPPILSLALIGALSVLLRSRPFHRYLAFWLVASSVPFVLGEYVVQQRILYNLPVHIFAVLGLDYVLRLFQRWLEPREAKILQSLFILLMVLMNANYGFRSAISVMEAFGVGVE